MSFVAPAAFLALAVIRKRPMEKTKDRLCPLISFIIIKIINRFVYRHKVVNFRGAEVIFF